LAVDELILKDIEFLDTLDIMNPLYGYYKYRVDTRIRISYDNNRISNRIADALRVNLQSVINKPIINNFYRTVRYFNLYSGKGNNILSNVKLEDILEVRSLCESLMILDDPESIVKMSSEKVAYASLLQCYNRCKELKTETESNELHISIYYLKKNILNCLRRSIMYEETLDILREYLEIYYKLLEENRMYYYRPPFVNHSMKDSNYFTSESFKNNNYYQEYYILKYRAKILEEYYLPNGSPKFWTVVEYIIDSIDKEEGLDKDSINNIKFSCRNYLKDLNEKSDPMEMITDSVYKKFEYITHYTLEQMYVVRDFIVDFIKSFSKENLVNYVVRYADLTYSGDTQFYTRENTHDIVLKHSLSELWRVGIITNKELEELYNSNKRGVENDNIGQR
jgi:hypothetical protein